MKTLKKEQSEAIYRTIRIIARANREGMSPIPPLLKDIERQGRAIDWTRVSRMGRRFVEEAALNDVINTNVFGLMEQFPVTEEEVDAYANTSGLSPSDVGWGAILIAAAGALALGDGPLPIGDALAIGLLAAAVVAGSGDGANDNTNGGAGGEEGDGEGKEWEGNESAE